MWPEEFPCMPTGLKTGCAFAANADDLNLDFAGAPPMMPTYRERQDLARQFPDAVTRMRRCLSEAGIPANDDEIVYAWANYSDTLCAQWLALPDTDPDLLAILKGHLRSLQSDWQVVIEDAGDGTGDGFILLPTVLLAQLGWAIGDTLESVAMQEGIAQLRRRE